ncbi:MAG: chromosome partitioning protein ParB, partial [Rhodobacterales bacterium]|nr:chromosome partitioning protein ParB [Rhodobacterales bacterium]
VAENVTQKAMDPLDEFEAFARMMEIGGQTPDAIARSFGVERRRVVERLRYGRVHPDIRAAARAKAISLDAMKAFAEHPDQSVQLATYEGMRGEYIQAWTIRDKLRRRGVKLGDALAQAVLEEYRAAGGEIAADLIEEDSILTDEALIDRLLMKTLGDHATEEAARLGFGWSMALREVDYKLLQEYGRVYPGMIDPEGEDAARCEAIADRLAALDAARDAAFDDDEEQGEHIDGDALEEEYEALSDEYDDLTTGWAPEDLARAGVLAHWDRGQIATVSGLIRPEDRTDRRTDRQVEAGGTAGAAGGGAAGGEQDGGADTLELANALKADLKTERAGVIGAALAADPDLAQDLLLFKTVADLLGRGGSIAYSFGVVASRSERPHGRPDGIDGRAAEAQAVLFAGLDLTWWRDDASLPERFEAFRALDPVMKSRIVAVALADAIKPSALGYGEALMCHVARQIVPDLRALWRPTGEAFFGRLKKSVLLGILARDLHQPEEAARLA